MFIVCSSEVPAGFVAYRNSSHENTHCAIKDLTKLTLIYLAVGLFDTHSF